MANYCSCGCGKEINLKSKWARGHNPNKGGKKSEYLNEIQIGDKFEHLIVIEPKQKGKRRESWLCQCECGRELILGRTSLLGTKTRRPIKSCGCKEYAHNGLIGKNKKLHDIWYRMVERCYNEKSKTYEYYGGKGVEVYDEWRNSYEIFYKWAINNGYKDELTIDRINTDGDYTPDNCRWVDWFIQAQNKGIRKNNKTGVQGAKLQSNGRYQLMITRNNKKFNLGMYDTIEEVAEARKKADVFYEENGTLDGYKPVWKRLRKP